jgi:hypothetical protein
MNKGNFDIILNIYTYILNLCRYTYLGNKKNSVKNPYLKVEGSEEYRHACYLEGQYE